MYDPSTCNYIPHRHAASVFFFFFCVFFLTLRTRNMNDRLFKGLFSGFPAPPSHDRGHLDPSLRLTLSPTLCVVLLSWQQHIPKLVYGPRMSFFFPGFPLGVEIHPLLGCFDLLFKHLVQPHARQWHITCAPIAASFLVADPPLIHASRFLCERVSNPISLSLLPPKVPSVTSRKCSPSSFP